MSIMKYEDDDVTVTLERSTAEYVVRVTVDLSEDRHKIYESKVAALEGFMDTVRHEVAAHCPCFKTMTKFMHA